MWCMAVFSKKKITSVHIAYAVTEATLFGQWLCNFCVCFVNSPMIMKLLFDAAIKACTTQYLYMCVRTHTHICMCFQDCVHVHTLFYTCTWFTDYE